MATAGVTHAVVLDGQGYLLGGSEGEGGKSGRNGGNGKKGAMAGYVQETLPGATAPRAALYTTGTEILASGSPATAPQEFRRVYWDEWRGVGRAFWRGGGNGDTRNDLAAPRSRAIDAVGETGGAGGLVAEMVNLRPLYQGAGLGLAPAEVTVNGVGSATASTFAAIIYAGTLYVIEGNTVYRATTAAGSFSGLVSVGTLPGPVVSAGYTQDGYAWACCGADAYRVDNLAINLGRPAQFMSTYQNINFAAQGTQLGFCIGYSSGANQVVLNLPREITALCVHEGALYIGAVDGLYKLEGTPQLATATTVFNGTNVKFDYKLSKLLAHAAGPTVGNLKSWQSLISFDGSLWGAMNGQLVRVRTGGSIGSYRVENQPVPSGWVASLAAAGGLLFAAIQVTGALSQLWGYDPQTGGWWRLAANFNIFYLFSGGEIVTNGQLMACRPNEAKLSRWAFNSSNPSGFEANNYGESWPGNSGYVTLPLLTPDDLASYAGLNNGRVGLVQVLRLGLEWHNFGGQDGWQGWPNVNTAGGGQLYYAAELSLDGGASWLTLNSAIVFDKYFPLALATGRTDWTIPTAVGLIKPVSRIYQGAAESDSNGLGWLFRLKVNGPISYLVRRAWLDFKLIEFNPQLGRRWKLALDLSNLPESIGLDGQPNPATPGLGEPPSLSGALLMAWRLWNLWKSGKTVSFYDLDGSGPYYVKLIGMRQEQVAPGYQPALKLAANWLAQVELVEVSE